MMALRWSCLSPFLGIAQGDREATIQGIGLLFLEEAVGGIGIGFCTWLGGVSTAARAR